MTSRVMEGEQSTVQALVMNHVDADRTLANFQALQVHRVQVGESDLAYRRFGEGPALVLLHGWPLSGSTYHAWLPVLGKHFTCYVPDLPGAGASPWDPSVHELFTDFGARVHGFCEALGLSRYGLIGHDSGGLIARVAASHAPARVFGIGLCNTEVPGHYPGFVRNLQRATHLPGAALAFRTLLGSRTYLRSNYGFGGCFKSLDYIDGTFSESCVASVRADTSSALRTLRWADLDYGDRMQALHDQLPLPLLCVWGDACRFFSVKRARDMVDRWPGPARLVALPGYKTFVHEEAPDLVLPHMLEFFKTLAASEGVALHAASA